MARCKVGIAGTRGIPAAYGGFETFAEVLSSKLVQKGYEVTVYCDHDSYPENTYQGVRLSFMTLRKSANQVLYFMLSLIRALRENDVVIVTSTGAAYFYWINTLFFGRVIITNSDGIENNRSKWSYWQKKYLQYSEWFAMRFSNVVIADSFAIADYLSARYRHMKSLQVIEYGAPLVQDPGKTDVLEKHGLKAGEYFIVVARLEPENNIQLIIEGFLQSNSTKKLVLVGSLIDNSYCKAISSYCSDRVLFLGAVYDQYALRQLRYYAAAYLHGHSVGGTNPSLLEAMGCGNVCICHDNVFNREVTAGNQLYFNSRESLASLLQSFAQLPKCRVEEYRTAARRRISEYYNWEMICERYDVLLQGLSKGVPANYAPGS
jgi:glycosyltransferase involved in cell wall biosynthesis